MASKSVKVIGATDGRYLDSNPFENADAALRGALALGAIISDATIGDNNSRWSNHVVDDLQTAQRVILCAAKDYLEELRLENWRAHALLGAYGPDAKARAENEMASEVRP